MGRCTGVSGCQRGWGFLGGRIGVQEGGGAQPRKADCTQCLPPVMISQNLPCPLSAALETEIKESNRALVAKSARLSGLQEQVGRIRDAIHKRVTYYESCS